MPNDKKCHFGPFSSGIEASACQSIKGTENMLF
jgi:hypothetical protein